MIALLLAAGLLLTPLVWLPGLGGFEAAKLAWLSFIAAAIMLYAAAHLFRSRRLVILRPRTSLAVAGLAIYLVILTNHFQVAVGWLGSDTNPLGILAYLMALALLLIFVNSRWPANLKLGLSWLAGLVGLGLLAGSLTQLWGWDGISWTVFDEPTRGRALFGAIGSANQLGIVAVLLLALAWPARRWLKPVEWQQWLFDGCLLALGILTLASKSISGILLLVIGIAAWWWGREVARRRRVIGIALGLSLLGLAVVSTSAGFNVIHKPLPSLADRIVTWGAGWRSWQAHPWGYGPTSFQTAYDRSYPSVDLNQRAVTEERAHSQPLEILVEWGLLGAILVLVLLGTLRQELDWSTSWLAALLWLIALLANFLIVPTLVIGLAIVWQASLGRHPPSWKIPPQHTTWVRFGLCTALTVAALCLIPFGWLTWSRSSAIDEAQQLSADYSFSAAANVLQDTEQGPWVNPIIHLKRAEALTNDALKFDDWSNHAEVLRELIASRQGMAFARTDAITLHLLSVWAPRDQLADRVFHTISTVFKIRQKENPRYTEFIAQLP